MLQKNLKSHHTTLLSMISYNTKEKLGIAETDTMHGVLGKKVNFQRKGERNLMKIYRERAIKLTEHFAGIERKWRVKKDDKFFGVDQYGLS